MHVYQLCQALSEIPMLHEKSSAIPILPILHEKLHHILAEVADFHQPKVLHFLRLDVFSFFVT
jgi:hypothetical protein